MPPTDTRRRKWRRPAIAAAIGVLVVILGGAYLADGDTTPRDPSADSSPTAAAVVAASAPPASGAARPSDVPHATGTTGAPGGGPLAAGSPSAGPTRDKGDPGTARPTKATPRTSALPSGPFNPDNMVIVSSDGTVLSATGTSDGSKVVTTAWRSLPGQRWQFESSGDALVVKSAPAKQLTVGYDGVGVLSSVGGGNGFAWVYDSARRQLRKRNTSGCLTSQGPGQQVTYGVCSSNQNQLWRVVS
ncbi:hypothetical protein [Micromonospora sp. NBC_01405]|uniref:hypothetical protein n=1 Tax=Micromonospora sp. NBC_01405 TaxID=2903589 RepID=UPI00386BF060